MIKTEERLYIYYFLILSMAERIIFLSKKYDLTNIRYGKLLVLKKTENPNNKKKQTYWLCECDCGKTSIVNTTDLNSGKITQCIECAHAQTGLHKRKDLTGITFGHLTVKKMIYGDNDGKTKCLCDCDCGNKDVMVYANKLQNNNSIHSCGCARKEIARTYLGKEINGMKFGRLTVLKTYWDITPLKVECICDCGNVGIFNKRDVQTGHTKSCGCLQSEIVSSVVTKDWSGEVSDYGIELLCQDTKNKNGQWLWKCKCGLCGNEFLDIPARIMNGHVTSCGCRRSSSKEQMIEEFLINNKINYKSQYSFNDCKLKYALRFDFALLDEMGELICLIEYDGKQHYEPIRLFGGYDNYQIIKKRDEIKNNYCNKNNLNLLRLPYYLADDEIKQKIINIIYP